VLLFLTLVPFRIVATGWLPGDDALRHAAKAVSGKDWSQVLVLRPEVTMDSHPGWHAVLEVVHGVSGADPHALALFSVLAVYLALLLPAVFLLRRPEAWALALAFYGALEPMVPTRFAMGRPFILSMAALVALCLLLARAPARPHRWRTLALVATLLGVVIWMHPSWHLFLLPVLACLLARRYRLALWLAGALLLGVFIAGVLHGNPFEFAWQSVLHTLLAFGTEAPPGTLAIEFTPGTGAAPLVLGVGLLLLWRYARGRWRGDVVDNPVFLLAATGWLLGWLVVRFWSDWGTPALLVWLALELQETLEEHLPPLSFRRIGLALVAGLAALLILSANTRGSRYRAPERPFLSLTSRTIGSALPDPGGILYTDDMRLFFQLFYHRPTAPWRYVVGYEPALMPPEDLATFRKVLAARTPLSFAPWVQKMTPADRLIIQSTEGQPQIPGLAWSRVSATVWSGRRPPGPPR
jgi:MFS family permease